MYRSPIAIQSTEKEEAITRYVKALLHPLRIRILVFPYKQACCFTGQLTEETLLAQYTISLQLKDLKDAGFFNGDVIFPTS